MLFFAFPLGESLGGVVGPRLPDGCDKEALLEGGDPDGFLLPELSEDDETP